MDSKQSRAAVIHELERQQFERRLYIENQRHKQAMIDLRLQLIVAAGVAIVSAPIQLLADEIRHGL